jgi:CubicO group peptidase (beta-lactamase class C family)
MSSPRLPDVHALLEEGVRQGVFPGGACAVYRDGALVHLSAAGQRLLGEAPQAMTEDTVFDLASVTKVVCTTTLLARLAGEGRLSLDELVLKQLPAAARGGKARLTLRDLLTHRSGLPAWRPYFVLAQNDVGARLLYGARPQASAAARARALVSEAVLSEPLEREPRLAAVYSDVGFLLLGLWLEKVGQAPLDEQVEALLGRLQLRTLRFRPLGARHLPDAPLAATGLRRPREPALGQETLFVPGDEAPARLGEVDDDNAYAMGGVAGHAGLFGSARDVGRWGALVLEDLEGAGRLAPAEVWRALATRDTTPGTTRALGFDTPSAEGSSAGARLGRGPSGAIGHLGFTGTSVWLDRDRKLSVALLTNRVHPRRGNDTIRAFRLRLHDAVIGALWP